MIALYLKIFYVSVTTRPAGGSIKSTVTMAGQVHENESVENRIRRTIHSFFLFNTRGSSNMWYQ
jgi:hypothetical protein